MVEPILLLKPKMFSVQGSATSTSTFSSRFYKNIVHTATIRREFGFITRNVSIHAITVNVSSISVAKVSSFRR